MNRINLLACCQAILVLLTLQSTAHAKPEPVSTAYLSNKAIGGHDSTAYHRLPSGGKAIKGSKTYTTKWKGANWYFTSENDKQAFLKNPAEYAPAYNGHCANALSLGEGLIPTNGQHWLVLDKQLYLFYAARGVERWLNGDYKPYKALADKAWNDILKNR